MSLAATTPATRTLAAAARLVVLGLTLLALAQSASAGTFDTTELRTGAGAIPAKPEVTPPVAITADSDDDRALAQWALSRFVEADLELPPLVVEFIGPSLEPCGGAQATARLAHEPVVVSVCWGTQLVILHELAHVWEAQAVSTEQRQRFMLTREGVASWSDPADPWADQGREHAANVIAWALMEDPVVIGRTYPNDRASLEEGFAILTGRNPLHAEGGEPVMVDRAAFDSVAARQEAASRAGIRSGR
jgi:hypothetical protein